MPDVQPEPLLRMDNELRRLDQIINDLIRLEDCLEDIHQLVGDRDTKEHALLENYPLSQDCRWLAANIKFRAQKLRRKMLLLWALEARHVS